MQWDSLTSLWDNFVWDSLETDTATATKKPRFMAANPTPDNPDVIASLVEDMLDGLDTHEVSLGIKKNTKAVVLPCYVAFQSTEDLFALKKTARAQKTALLSSTDQAGEEWLAKAAKVLRIALGERWNMNWEPTHFPDNSTQVPGSADKRFTLLGKLKTYFQNNPTKEAPNQGVTAAAAGALHTAISDARDALGQAKADQRAAKTPRDAALKALKKRVRSLIDELGEILSFDDPRWDAFGLSRPSDPDTPLPATDFTATPAGPGALLYKWKRGKRATYYRLFYKIIGTDTDFHQYDPNPQGLSQTIENLPPRRHHRSLPHRRQRSRRSRADGDGERGGALKLPNF